jgi:hypothetical protein
MNKTKRDGADAWAHYYYIPKVGDVVTVLDLKGRWRITELDAQGHDCHRLVSLSTDEEAGSLYHTGCLTPARKRKPKLAVMFGATVNSELWALACESQHRRETAENLTQALRCDEDAPGRETLIHALKILARLTKAGRHFPELTHACTPEAVRCAWYRLAVMSKTGEACRCKDLAHHKCRHWSAAFAGVWVSHFARAVAEGRDDETIRFLRRNLTALHPVPELNEQESAVTSHADPAEERVAELRRRLDDLDESDYPREGERFRLEKEIYDLEHPIDVNDWSAWEEGVGND